MKYFGGILILIYAAITLMGFEPFSTAQRGTVPPEARGRPGSGGGFFWTGGFMGGK